MIHWVRQVTTFFESRRLQKLATESSAAFLNLENCKDIEDVYKEQIRAFKRDARKRNQSFSSIQKRWGDARTIAETYDVEYQTGNYAYLSALLIKSGFERITGYTISEAPTLNILDIGAGSNELLRFCHTELAVPAKQLSGSDISGESVQIIKRDGFNGYLGRAEALPLARESFGLVFLSYFIDYDTNQRATFEGALQLLKTGGTLVFEGLLPCKSVNKQERSDESFITRGRSAAEDARLIIDAVQSIAQEQSCTMKLQRIVLSHRYVHSRFGLNCLTSHFLVFTKT